MSIISEALKKAQDTRAEDFKPALGKTTPQSAEYIPENNTTTPITRFGIIAVVLITLSLLSIIAIFFVIPKFLNTSGEQEFRVSASPLPSKTIEETKPSAPTIKKISNNKKVPEIVDKMISYSTNNVTLPQ